MGKVVITKGNSRRFVPSCSASELDGLEELMGIRHKQRYRSKAKRRKLPKHLKELAGE